MKKLCLTLFAVVLMTLIGTIAAHAQQAMTLDKALEYLNTYQSGTDRTPLNIVVDAVRAANQDPAARKELAGRLAKMLPAASMDAKRFIGRQLMVIGGADVVPAFAALMQDDNTLDIGVLVLESIPDEAAGNALRDALKSLPENRLIAVIDALGRRGEAQSVPALTGFITHADANIAKAAITALGLIGGDAASAALTDARSKANGDLRISIADACLMCADHLLKAGNTKAAAALFESLTASGEAGQIRAAALNGLVKAQPEESLPKVAAALNDNDRDVVRVAAFWVRKLPGDKVTGTIADMLPKASPELQTLLIQALADRGDRAAAKAVQKIIESENASARLAAIKAMGILGDGSLVETFIKMATDEKGEMRDAAKENLVKLTGDGVNSNLEKFAKKGSEEIRLEAITALAKRHAVDAKPALMKLAAGNEAKISEASYTALRVIADDSDLPQLLKMFQESDSDAARELIQKTVVAITQHIPDKDKCAAIVLKELGANSRPEMRAAAFTILGSITGKNALEALRAAAKEDDATVRGAAVAALAAWPAGETMPDLFAIAKAPKGPEDRAKAIEGCLRILRADEARPVEERVKDYGEILSLASTPEEKKKTLAGLSALPSLAALDLAQNTAKDAAVAPEANAATLKIAQAIAGAYPDKAKACAEPLSGDSTEENLRNQAKAIAAEIAAFEDYLCAWEVAGPYTEAGKIASELFSTPFAPETQPDSIPWNIMPMGANPKVDHPWIIDLFGTFNDARECVAFLRTKIWSPKAQKAIFELGSSDGAKLWVNGESVYALNDGRAFTPGEDKIAIQLKEGWNPVMLAVYQMGGEWSASARLRTPAGAPLEGVKCKIAE